VQYVLTSVQRPLPKRSRGLRLVFRSRTTLIYRLATASPYFSAAGCRTSSGSDDSATAVCPRSTTLVRRETWSPGWSAEVDGHSVPVRRGDGAFQAVAIPAGSHHVTFSFTPPGMGWAGLGLLAGCALTLTPMMRRVRSLGPGGALVRGSRPSDQPPGRA
jgi:hypothetical protein